MTSSLKWRGKSFTSKAKLVQSCILLLTLKFLFSCFSTMATLGITWEKLKNNNDRWCLTSAPGRFKQNFWEGNPSSERILNVPQIVLRCGWIKDDRALSGWWAEHREAGGKQWLDGAPVESRPLTGRAGGYRQLAEDPAGTRASCCLQSMWAMPEEISAFKSHAQWF